MATSYFTFRTSQGPAGLVRRRQAANDDTIERVTAERDWIEDGELIRYFVNPGTSFFEQVDAEQAAELAERYGVAL